MLSQTCGITSTAIQPSAIAIAAASHFGASTQQTLSHDRDRGAGPDDAEHGEPPVAVEDQQPDRRVAAGDQEVDAGVVDAAHHAAASASDHRTRW